jgi:hypothetical protein
MVRRSQGIPQARFASLRRPSDDATDRRERAVRRDSDELSLTRIRPPSTITLLCPDLRAELQLQTRIPVLFP